VVLLTHNPLNPLTARAVKISEYETIRFVLVGFVNTLICLAVIYICKAWGVMDVPANMIGYASGTVSAFTLHRSWTFKADGDTRGALIRFVITIAIAYLSNMAALLLLLNLGVNSYVAQAASICVYVVASYLLCKNFAFRQRC
jgi:putative flippase GtrA